MKPSKITAIKAKKNKFLCPIGFTAITLFGTIFTRSESLANNINRTAKIDSILKSHEFIHIKQAENTHDSWILYYIIYIWQWLKNLPLIFIDLKAPYRFIAMELEAYLNQDNLTYATESEGGCSMWRKLDELTLKKKWNLAKEFKNMKGKNFSYFLVLKSKELL